MAKTRECDRHGGTFSERETGWAEGKFIVHRRYDDGAPNDENVPVDFCPTCVNEMMNPPKRDAEADYAAAVLSDRPHYDPEYVKWLEEKNNVGKPDIWQQTLDETGTNPYP